MHYLISLSFTYGSLGISVKGMVDFCDSPDGADRPRAPVCRDLIYFICYLDPYFLNMAAYCS
jgi:hypothetical protein